MKGGDVAKAGQVQHVAHAQNVQQVDASRRIDQMARTDKAELNKFDKHKQSVTGKGMDPVAQKSEVNKSGSMAMSIMNSMEKGQMNLDALINGGLSGKQMSNTDLLQMQAGMYKYTQELDLCSKVVEKATTGLKDTLKTNV